MVNNRNQKCVVILYSEKKQRYVIHVVHIGKASIPANHMIYVIQMQTLRHAQFDLRPHFAGSVILLEKESRCLPSPVGVFKSRWWKPLLRTPAVQADDLCGRNVGYPEVGGGRAGRTGRGPRGTQQRGEAGHGGPGLHGC